MSKSIIPTKIALDYYWLLKLCQAYYYPNSRDLDAMTKLSKLFKNRWIIWDVDIDG